MKSIKLTAGTKFILLAALLAALVAVPFVITNKYVLHVIISCFIYSCLALSLKLIIGLT